MKNLRNKNQPPNADLVQVYLQSSWDIVTDVYAELANIQTVADAINGGTLDQFLTETDIDTLAKVNAIFTDFQVGRFSTQAEAEGGLDNTTTMTPLRVAQAIAVLAAGLQHNYAGSGPPTVTDDANLGYSAGSIWFDITADPDETYRCTDPTIGAAVWIKTSLTSDELATVAISGSSDDLIEGATQLLMTVTERSKLSGIENNATADQTDAEIETAYNNQVAVVTQGEAEAGTLTTVKRWTPERVKQAIAALASGGMVWTSYNTSQSVAAGTGSVFYGLAATVTATLPATPNVGDTLMIMNNDNNALDSYNVNITAGGSNEIIEQNINYIPQATVQQGQTALLVCRENGATKRWHMQRWTSALDLGGTGGGMTVTSVKTGNYTASANEVVPVDSTSSSFTITMPAGMSANERVIVADVGKYCGVNPVTIGRNSQTIDGAAEDFSLDQNNGRFDGMADGLGDIVTHLIGTPEIVNINDFATGFGGVNPQTGTTYTFADNDLALLVTASNAASSAYDIPDSLGAVGETLNLLNIGVGTVTIAVPGTDTLASTANDVATGKAATIVKTAATTWWVVGGA